MDRGSRKDAENTESVVQFFLWFAKHINRGFWLVTKALQILLLPQLSRYQRQVYLVISAAALSSDMALLTIAKTLQNKYGVENFLLLLSLGSVLPFFQCVYSLWTHIPCPNIANLISNSLLAFTLVTLIILGASAYSDVWTIFGYVGVLWPWLVLASMVSRLYTERNTGRNPFSPVRELPLLGLMSAAAYVMMLQALKAITVTDCVALVLLDAVVAAILCPLVLGRHRRALHFTEVKSYALLVGLFVLYLFNDVGAGDERVLAPNSSHLMFLGARCLLIMRSVFVKWHYCAYYDTKAPLTPPDDERLFLNGPCPKKHRFHTFPAPTLLVLDCIFDSGLRDTEMHGMGKLGTQDLYMLTDSTYILPSACMFTWLIEKATLHHGIFPENFATDSSVSSASAVDVVVASEGGAATTIAGATSNADAVLIVVLVIFFVISRLLAPWATAHALYDRASSMHSWKYQPIICLMPYFLIDIGWLNGNLSKFQIILILLLAACLAHYRDGLWVGFKRKYLLLCTQETHFYQPSAMRSLQRRTLLEFLSQTSTDDYELMLFETTMRHGANIRELARDVSIKVWDPSPSATAAWKLALSLVTRSIRRSKLLQRQKHEKKNELHKWVETLVVDIVDRAVDTAAGHGARLRAAGALADVLSKRRAIRRLQALAERRRCLRQKRKTGELAIVPMRAATVGGVLRSTRDMATLTETSGSPPRYMLEMQAEARAEREEHQASLQMSLTGSAFRGFGASVPRDLDASASRDLAASASRGFAASASRGFGASASRGFTTPASPTAAELQDLEEGYAGEGAPLLSLPGELIDEAAHVEAIPSSDDIASPKSAHTQASSTGFRATLPSGRLEEPDGRPRGVYSMDGWPGDADRGTLLGTVVLAWGDPRRGQLGPNALTNARGSVGVPTVVEDLRGMDPVQIEAAGMASFVVGARGHVWGFGSNRSMELGCRKEVTQLDEPQRIKPIREQRVVQIASSSSASGQAFTYTVTDIGQVHTFGTSATGGLGQGPDVRSTAPMLMRFTKEVKVQQVALGARHAILLSDDGKVFACGDNSRGQLGLGQLPLGPNRKRLTSISSPQPVGGDLANQPVKRLAVGEFHALATLELGGSLYAWGANADGQLGLGNASDQNTPQVVRDLQDARVTSMACGARHSLVVTHNGTQLWAFGSNAQGQLGLGPNTFIEGQQRSAPALCTAMSGQRGVQIIQVIAAAHHSLLLTRVGEVFSFGDNAYGQLGFPPEGKGPEDAHGPPRAPAGTARSPVGIGSLAVSRGRAAREIDQPRAFADGVARLWLPARVVGLSYYHVRAIATAEMHSLALATSNF